MADRKYPHLHRLEAQFNYLCDIGKTGIFATYMIPRKENVIADRLSRMTLHPQHEQRLPVRALSTDREDLWKRSADLFATCLNTQIPTYHSLNLELTTRHLRIPSIWQRLLFLVPSNFVSDDVRDRLAKANGYGWSSRVGRSPQQCSALMRHVSVINNNSKLVGAG
jgi:hypothetical protein